MCLCVFCIIYTISPPRTSSGKLSQESKCGISVTAFVARVCVRACVCVYVSEDAIVVDRHARVFVWTCGLLMDASECPWPCASVHALVVLLFAVALIPHLSALTQSRVMSPEADHRENNGTECFHAQKVALTFKSQET